MPTTYLTDFRNVLRADLHDEDSGSYRWTDEALDRHIERALQEFSAASPQTAMLLVDAVAGAWEYDLSGYADLKDRPAAILSVEWPYVAEVATTRVLFSVRANMLRLLVDEAPAAGDVLRLCYTVPHVLSETEKTLAPEDEPLVALGAAAYALLERAGYAAERITPTVHAADSYATWGRQALERFCAALDRLQRQRDVAEDGRLAWKYEG